MEDPSDRLRRDHDRQNRRREENRYDRRAFVDGLDSVSRIKRLNEQIEAAKAFETMTAGWPEARAAIESCDLAAPDVQANWLKTFDAIRTSAKPSQSQSLVELETDVNKHVDTLSGISADLRKVAESRKSSALPRSLADLTAFPEPTPLDEFMLRSSPRRWRAHVQSGLLPTGTLPWAPGPSRCADDLKPIHDQILMSSRVPNQLRFAWLDRLDKIDKRDSRPAAPSAVEKIEALISDIDIAAAELRSVAAALGYQASKCRWFWRR